MRILQLNMEQFEGLNAILAEVKIRPETMLLVGVGVYDDMDQQLDIGLYMNCPPPIIIGSKGQEIEIGKTGQPANSSFDTRDDIMSQELGSIITSSFEEELHKPENILTSHSVSRASSPIAILTSESCCLPILTSSEGNDKIFH